ncbi:HTH-type transcriptional regulator GntR [Hahella sp. KA22]|uniref:gluconate operon transcriptional repressor GntR n=1 Tax=Hahella sp. KA22 TaxID=1628392 RepID=UPI000FDEF2DD|nr:gluconate operon transcriptional repressor GntR [Hahella sp. KA22]AZZ92343.1 HTH-type transcriptional regulator GntR [Hahella sp. KA22]QAY55716.1 HTH-type transcriptional regulator GntR [Hahella sp. KA22]
MKKRRPTLQDIADQVGATKMTVSRCLRQPELVSEPLRHKIQTAVRELGYIPNRAPDILSKSRSHAIGVLIPSLTNQVFSDVIRGIEQVTESRGYHLMFTHYGYSPELEEQNLANLLAYNVDGLIMSESRHTERALQMIRTAGTPTVEIMDTRSPALDQAIGFDNVQAAYDMTRTLIQRGYRRTAYLSVRLDTRTLQRQEGYQQAMRDAGLEPRTMQYAARSSFSVGAHLMTRILDEMPETDAIFCTNDDVAIGAYFECLRRGIKVPQEMAIAGFHGHDVGQVMTPQLASVLTPRHEMGALAAEALLARLDGQTDFEPMMDLGYVISLGGTI